MLAMPPQMQLSMAPDSICSTDALDRVGKSQGITESGDPGDNGDNCYNFPGITDRLITDNRLKNGISRDRPEKLWVRQRSPLDC